MLKSVKNSLMLLSGLFLLSLLIIVMQSQKLQTELVRAAENIFVSKDVVADILPPPLYLIEMRLTLSMAIEGSLPVDEAIKKYQKLVSSYDERIAHWSQNSAMGLEKKLAGRQHETAKRFMAAAKTQILDKLASGDKQAAQSHLAQVHSMYIEHRNSVDETVAEANMLITSSLENFGTHVFLWVFGSVIVAVMFFLTWKISTQIIKPIQASSQLAHGISTGDLTQHLELSDKLEVAQLQKALLEMQNSLRKMVGQVRQSTDNIHHSSAEIAHGNTDLSHRTEQTAANLQQAASSMQQVTTMVKHSADNARQANQLAAHAAEVAARGGQVVTQVVSTMDDINASSKKISDIIGVIDGIAFQTNILALNAAVEAARAGEQGRGFAVVASEVRSLAGRSAEAAKEIKSLIGASVDRVETGSRLVENAGSTMKEIVSSVQRVSDIISEITAASTEQSEGMTQVSHSVMQLDQMTQQNAALVEQGAAAAESLRDQATRLAQLVSTFKIASEAQAQWAGGALAGSKSPPEVQSALHSATKFTSDQ
ncbi:MAG: methyl-accepting chemotaxis protein [Burkholderiales bacterium]